MKKFQMKQDQQQIFSNEYIIKEQIQKSPQITDDASLNLKSQPNLENINTNLDNNN